jgi:hypothetical protein
MSHAFRDVGCSDVITTTSEVARRTVTASKTFKRVEARRSESFLATAHEFARARRREDHSASQPLRSGQATCSAIGMTNLKTGTAGDIALVGTFAAEHIRLGNCRRAMRKQQARVNSTTPRTVHNGSTDQITQHVPRSQQQSGTQIDDRRSRQRSKHTTQRCKLTFRSGCEDGLSPAIDRSR